MGSIGQYIVRTTLGAFLLVLVSLTIVIWVTHALRDIDLVTSQGQTVLVFVGLTALLIPALVLVIAPLAFVIAVIYVLNKLNADSEIIVMNAAGMSPWRIFRPFLTVSLIVATLVAAISAYIAPKCLRELRTLISRVRADLVANVIQPGRFTSLQGGQLTFHIRERRTNGELGGIFIDDRRDPNLRATFLAERGIVLENENGSFLVLENGSAQRVDAKEPDPTIVLFERYAFDMTQFSGANYVPTFNVTERYLWDLIWPDPEDPYYKANTGRFRAEINDRLLAPVFPVIFALLAFAILGAPRTSRQSRGLSMLMAIVTVATVRLIGFACVVFAAKTPGALVVLYVTLAAAVCGGVILLARGAAVEPPAFLVEAFARLQARFSNQAAPA
ncbi:MAG: LPS export ABC transporter permease LptF [Variibacter sp.]|nr:LPS export ABC transporter permease LptF [Variibacter sp.]